ncbi:MAG: DUF4910 domain-containing protein [Bryobacteraceae bacterium]
MVKTRLDAGVVDAKERQATIRQLFADAGCAVEEQAVDKKNANVICTLPGETSSTIVIGGHFDFADHGQGIIDDWSGTALLPSLYQALKGRPRRHTYTFIAFASEEKGLVGSTRYVKKLTPEQRSLIRAFINLECLGLSPVKVWLTRSTPSLVGRLDEVAKAINIALEGMNVDKVGDDDTHPFLSAKIPVISIHSINQATYPLLHSNRDNVAAIQADEYYKAYRLAAYYLAYLDVKTE